jgi:hypothetical protein
VTGVNVHKAFKETAIFIILKLRAGNGNGPKGPQFLELFISLMGLGEGLEERPGEADGRTGNVLATTGRGSR